MAKTSEAGMMKVDDIYPNEVALRAVDKDSDKYAELLSSVQANGVLESVTVTPVMDEKTGEERMTLVNGLHRWTAAKQAGIEEIPVSIVKNMNKLDVLRTQVILNLQRVETKPVEYARQIQQMIAEDQSLSMAELAAQLHVSSQYIHERLGLLKLDAEIAEQVDNGTIKLTNALFLAKLPQEEQSEHVSDAITMPAAEFATKVKDRQSALRKAAREGKDPAAPNVWQGPIPKLRKAAALLQELEQASVCSALIQADTPAQEAFKLGVQFALQIDPISAQEQKEQWEAKQAMKEKLKAERQAAREKAAAEKEADVSVKPVI